MTDAASVGGAMLSRLLQLSSAASPVGSFAYSDGMEQAIELGDVHDEASAREWIGGLLEHGICALDVPVLLRMRVAWLAQQPQRARRHSAWLLACRETGELRAADRAQAQALVRILVELEVTHARALVDEPDVSYACAFALAAAAFAIPSQATATGYAHAWAENMVLAAVKLVPLGQASGQRMLFEFGSRLEHGCLTAANIELDDIAPGAPGQAIASARHEAHEGTRLFRS